MIKYQDSNTNQTLGGGPPRGTRWREFKYLNILLIVAFAILLGIVAYAAYMIGENQGVTTANADRDAFYRQRIAQLSGYGPPTPSTPSSSTSTTPGASVTGSSNKPVITSGQGTLARVDKIEGDKMTVLLLDGKTGAPNGVTLVISLSQQPTVWKSDRTDSTALAPGQNILFVGQSDGNNGVYTVQGVLILPLAEQ